MLRQLLILLALLLVIACALSAIVGMRSATAHGAAEAVRVANEALARALGSPAHARAVRRLMRDSLRKGEPKPTVLAEALGRAGGCAALEGALRFLHERDRDIRIAALASIEKIGLRSSQAAHAVFRIAQRRLGDERLAAIAALGAVGDGRDIDLLLLLAQSKDDKERRAAFRALRRIADVPIPPVHARWTWHWRVLKERARSELMDALETLEATPEGKAVRSQRAALARHAWVDVELVDEYLEAWLRSQDRAKHGNACWIVGALRLADHGEAILRCRTLARDGSPLAVLAEEALRVLGVRSRRAP